MRSIIESLERLSNIESSKEMQARMLIELSANCQKTPLYKNKIYKIKDLEDLSDLPLTFYEDIYSTIRNFGQQTFVENPVKCWHTSGYSGEPKKFYFSQSDVDAIANISTRIGCILGLKKGDIVWNLCAPEPYASGSVLHIVAKRMSLKEIFTPLEKSEDIVTAMKKISKIKKIDAICGIPVIFSTIGEIIKNPKVFERQIAKKIQKKLGIFSPFTDFVKLFYVRGIKYAKLRTLLSKVEKAIFFGEILEQYKQNLKEIYPMIVPLEVYGSTELIVGATQLSPQEGLSVWLDWFIPEIADPVEIIKAKMDKNYQIKTVPWWKWRSGLKGELIITKNWKCLPLVRYPTGDLIEVISPCEIKHITIGGEKIKIKLPSIRILGRSCELIDFSVPEEEARIMGVASIFSREIKEAMGSVKKFGIVKWWDLFVHKNATITMQNTLGNYAREINSIDKLKFEIIPNCLVINEKAFRKEIIEKIREKCVDFNYILNRLEDAFGPKVIEQIIEIEILKPDAYEKIEKEIERRLKVGKPLGQIKPKQIHVLRKNPNSSRNL